MKHKDNLDGIEFRGKHLLVAFIPVEAEICVDSV